MLDWNTHVLTPYGARQVEGLKVGDVVQGVSGYYPITGISIVDYQGQMTRLVGPNVDQLAVFPVVSDTLYCRQRTKVGDAPFFVSTPLSSELASLAAAIAATLNPDNNYNDSVIAGLRIASDPGFVISPNNLLYLAGLFLGGGHKTEQGISLPLKGAPLVRALTILTRFNIKYTYIKRLFINDEQPLARVIVGMFWRGKSGYFPPPFLACSNEALSHFFKGFIDAVPHQSWGWRFVARRRNLIFQLAGLANRLGYPTTIECKVNKPICYTLRIFRTPFRVRESYPVNYNDRAFSLSLDDGAFLAIRNGKVFYAAANI